MKIGPQFPSIFGSGTYMNKTLVIECKLGRFTKISIWWVVDVILHSLYSKVLTKRFNYTTKFLLPKFCQIQ